LSVLALFLLPVGWGNPMRLNGWAPDGRRPLTAICAQMPHVA
jgi:hypothetical protein